MGFIANVVSKVLRQAIMDEAFKRGLNGEPPLQAVTPEYQPLFDEAYEKGQKAMINNVVKKLQE